jgi:hypothetical protein
VCTLNTDTLPTTWVYNFWAEQNFHSTDSVIELPVWQVEIRLAVEKQLRNSEKIKIKMSDEKFILYSIR